MPIVTVTLPKSTLGTSTLTIASCVASISPTATVIVEANLDTLNVALASLAKYISVSANLATTS